MAPGKEGNGGNVGNIFDLLHNHGMLSILIKIASVSTQHTIS